MKTAVAKFCLWAVLFLVTGCFRSAPPLEEGGSRAPGISTEGAPDGTESKTSHPLVRKRLAKSRGVVESPTVAGESEPSSIPEAQPQISGGAGLPSAPTSTYTGSEGAPAPSTQAGVNSGPTFTVASFDYSPGIDENGALLVRYDDLIGYSGASDANGDIIQVKVIRLTSGTITSGVTTYSTAGLLGTPLLVGPGQTFIWRPATNANGTILAFGITLTDSVADSAEIPVSVVVSSINSAPTIAYTQPILESAPYYAPSNNPYAMSYSALIDALGVSDIESGTTGLTLSVSEWLGGQGIGYSSSSTCASGVTYFTGPLTVSTSSSATYLCWIPPTATSGNIAAFRLQVSDSGGAISGQTALVYINVEASSNNAPTFFTGCRSATNSTTVACSLSDAYGTTSSTWDVRRTNGGTVSWTFEQLKGMTGVTDSDSPALYFVVTSINTSFVTGTATLQKGGVNMQVYTTGTPNSAQLISAGETIVYTTRSTTGTLNASAQLFTVKAWDGLSSSLTAVPVHVVPRSSYDLNPTFTFSAPIPLTTVEADVWNEITYDQVREHTDADDIDDPARTLMRFLISGSPGANITVEKKGGGACGTGNTSITAGSTYLNPNESLCVMLNATSSSTLSTPTNMLPAVNLQTTNRTAAGAHGSNVGSFIPLMIRAP